MRPDGETAAKTVTGTRVVTLGCRLNTYESEVMKVHADAAGLDGAIVVNTCAVTNEAVRQARQTIRRARRDHPDAKIVVTGCAAQIDPSAFAGMDEVDHVLGNAEKMAPESFHKIAGAKAPAVEAADIMEVTGAALFPLDDFETRARAHIQIQNGCDHRCTFCIIPYGRGNSRSVPAGALVDQIRRLVDAGHREVVLTGVDITSYGEDLPGRPRLGDLCRRILKLVPELPRLRLSSIDAVEIDDTLLGLLGDEPRLMPHLHLSLQSGDDMILKRMKRRHSRADAVALTDQVRARRPDVVFGADIIAGFPTETEAMFANSLSLAEECGLTWLHVFPFSPREGTPAARMPQLPRPLVKQRAARLRALAEARAAAHAASLEGQVLNVLVERPGFGRAEGFEEVTLAGTAAGAAVREIVTVTAAGADGARLTGHIARDKVTA
jgi:threonylcarbamoyladenosine tRNA methylthiotransferase MtaB